VIFLPRIFAKTTQYQLVIGALRTTFGTAPALASILPQIVSGRAMIFCIRDRKTYE
jgi:hypothetical protein